ncbi:unnamed protein product [Aureobasidium pullulans]|nr:unnamed protein product [Aureobasidium pullulans]
MPPTASRSRMGVLPLFALFSSALAQSIPGASYFTGGGVPGSGAYQLVDDYQPSVFSANSIITMWVTSKITAKINAHLS